MQRKGKTVVLIGGQENILSFDQDLAWIDREVTQINFNRTGEVVQVKEFRKDKYEPILKRVIQDQLMKEEKRFFGHDLGLDREQAIAISDTLADCGETLVTVESDIYRISSIVDKRFSDDQVVNPFNDVDSDGDIDADSLRMGIFIVKS